jgi:8-oxo-dGTP pyrophosphatase MutT (NUDIX family)
MWIGRRSADRYSFPDQLDQMVAGGLPFGIAPEENLAKECEEEAGMQAELAASAVATGSISYRRETPAGLRSDTIFCYDITLPLSFKPVCSDGEVGEFYLWPLEEVARVVRETEEFKPNCNLVVIDFLLRHGLIDAGHPEFSELSSGLQSL